MSSESDRQHTRRLSSVIQTAF